MIACIFTLRDGAGRFVGQAVVCAAARYASIAWRGAQRFERRFGVPAIWRAIETELSRPIPARQLKPDDPIVQLLVGDRDRPVMVQYLAQLPLAAAMAPADLVTVLDQRLRLAQQ